jgi:hypothetical protein
MLNDLIEMCKERLEVMKSYLEARNCQPVI